jgi:hypothetical protein
MTLLVLRFLLVLTFLEITLAKTCEERLENLETLFDSLKLRLDGQTLATNGVGKSGQDALKIEMEKERRGLERRVASLEKALTESKRETYLLQARFSELERKSLEQEIRLAAVGGKRQVSETKGSNRDTYFDKKAQLKQIDDTSEANILKSFQSDGDNFT